MKLTILIPAYNESLSIETIMREIKALDLSSCGITKREIILIDDASTDGTVKKATSVIPETKVIYHSKNQGKGAALATGLPHTTGDIILIQDADLEYRPSLYPALLRPMVEQNADIVYGSRFLGIKRPKDMKTPYYLANLFGTWLTNKLLKTSLTDSMTCFKLFKKEVLSGVKLKTKGFGADAELTAKAVKKGFKITEVAIPYKARTFKEGKKYRPILSIFVLWSIIKYGI
ncbi:MAG: glycosyltransferase family 2 protein [Candidatus Omnitrophica bacterium]|nr:glycosyltransferase family 2 protein [Candidatus Omnitrophota bacterium]